MSVGELIVTTECKVGSGNRKLQTIGDSQELNKVDESSADRDKKFSREAYDAW